MVGLNKNFQTLAINPAFLSRDTPVLCIQEHGILVGVICPLDNCKRVTYAASGSPYDYTECSNAECAYSSQRPP